MTTHTVKITITITIMVRFCMKRIKLVQGRVGREEGAVCVEYSKVIIFTVMTIIIFTVMIIMMIVMTMMMMMNEVWADHVMMVMIVVIGFAVVMVDDDHDYCGDDHYHCGDDQHICRIIDKIEPATQSDQSQIQGQIFLSSCLDSLPLLSRWK